jgi:hypothetical protein
MGNDIVVMIKHIGGSIGLSKVGSRLDWDSTVRRDFTLRLKTNIRSMIGGGTRWQIKIQLEDANDSSMSAEDKQLIPQMNKVQ